MVYNCAMMRKMISAVGSMLLAVLLTLFSACGTKPVKIGFAGCLTGKMSDLGISGRNAVQLAVEEINQAGGIGGRPVELIVKNNRQDEEAARKAVEDLIGEGVTAIVGHMTSSMSASSLPLINEHETVMISPTSSSALLSGLDDYFFRVVAPNESRTEATAEYAAETLDIRSASAIIDTANSIYSRGWKNNFARHFQNAGGELLETITFNSYDNPDYLGITNRALQSEPEAVVVVANAFDTAQFCQQFAKYSPETVVIPSGWAMTEELIRQGGESVEGLVFAQIVDLESQKPRFLAFKRNYEDRFGMVPDFAAVHAYTAVQILERAVESTPKKGSLKETILSQKMYRGLQSTVEFDAYGDPYRKPFIFTVEAGEFVNRTE